MDDVTSRPGPAGGRAQRAVRVVGDVVLVLLVWGLTLVLLGYELDADPGRRSDAVLGADLLLGVLTGASLAVRRRWPLVVATVAVPASAVSTTAGLAAVVALFAVTVRRRPAVSAVVAGATLVAGTVQTLLWPEPDLPWWGAVLVLGAVVVGVFAWGSYVRARRQLTASWRDAADRARAEQELRSEQARSVERARIAREMHDVLAHRISLVSMHAGALELRLEGSADPDVVRSAGTIRHSAHAALEVRRWAPAPLRDILGVLREESARSQEHRPQPTLAQLPALVAEVTELGLPVDLDVQVVDDVPDTLGRTAFRVVQEGLTNARKHAPGHAVRVRVSGRRGRRLDVVVRDAPAAGVPSGLPAPSSGFGLVGLRERVELVGGTLRARRAGEGFELTARLPWPRRP